MITLCHQNSHDETLNVKDDFKIKKFDDFLFIQNFTSDLTGTYIYVYENFKSYTIIIYYFLTNKNNYNYIFMHFYALIINITPFKHFLLLLIHVLPFHFREKPAVIQF